MGEMPACNASWDTLRRPVERSGVPASSRSGAVRILLRMGGSRGNPSSFSHTETSSNPAADFAEQPAPQRRTNHIPPAIHKIAVTIRHRHRTAIAGNLHDHRARSPRRTGPRPVPPAPRGRWPPTCGACPLTSASEYRPGPSSRAISVPKTVMSTRLSATPSTRRHGWQTGPRTSKNGCCVPPPRSTAPTKRSDGRGPCRARRCCAAGRDSPRSRRPRAGARRACW